MKFYDAHNHLQDDRFAGRQAELVAASRAAGVARMVVNGSCEEDWPQVSGLAREFPDLVVPSFGYHPWFVGERTPRWREALVEFLDRTPGAVVGEIGLDRWKPGLSCDGQEEVFLAQLRLAAERNLAASIHCLQTWGRLLELLRTTPRPARGFLLHSYGGPAEMVPPLAKLGAHFGFPGYFMHDRKARQREAFKLVPADRLLIETDAPDQLLPDAANLHPLTDARTGRALNHPANLPDVYQFMADLRGEPLTTLAAQVEESFRRLFGAARAVDTGGPTLTIPLMSNDIIYPRSARETMAGWAYLPRFVDKIRLHLAGKLHTDYQENFAHKGFDAKWLQTAGLTAEQFIAVVKDTVTDAQVCDWVAKNVKKSAEEKAAFNQAVLNYGRENDPAVKARLQMRKEQSGLGHRDDLQCFVDYIDADEKRI